MGQDEERERRLSDLAGFQVDDAARARLGPDEIVHHLPAHYGEEVTESVPHGPRSSGTRPRTGCTPRRR